MKSQLPKIQGLSHTWYTTTMIMLIVMVSVLLSLWFFWRSLYLPELRNHASYLANHLVFLDKIDRDWQHQPKVKEWYLTVSHLQILTDPNDFPDVTEKTLVGYFTNAMQQQIGQDLGRPAIVYFKFKPIPMLYVQDSQHPEFWLQEPVKFYAQYSSISIFFFLLGIPLVTLWTIIFFVRQLNRPLKRLQKTASDYILFGHVNRLPTNQGSTEIRQVNVAFNHLFDNLIQTQKERNLMLAGISHDLRTPLTRMRLTAEMLPDEFFKEGIIYDIEDMDAILEQFISFMKDGSDEPLKMTDLSIIFHEIVVQFAPLTFVVNIDDDLPQILLRPLSIKRLIINLVNNANRYGKPPVHLHAHLLHANDKNHKPFLKISVSDEGDGIADDQIERIMQPFERGEQARSTQGSGLGLSIVQRITKLHNGQMFVDNHHQGGLKVTILIPIHD